MNKQFFGLAIDLSRLFPISHRFGIEEHVKADAKYRAKGWFAQCGDCIPMVRVSVFVQSILFRSLFQPLWNSRQRAMLLLHGFRITI